MNFSSFSATSYQCDAALGLENGLIPTTDLSVSSQKNTEATINAIRMGYTQLWAAATSDQKPWIEIRFNQAGKTLTGFDIRGSVTIIDVQYDTLTQKNNNYTQNVRDFILFILK